MTNEMHCGTEEGNLATIAIDGETVTVIDFESGAELLAFPLQSLLGFPAGHPAHIVDGWTLGPETLGVLQAEVERAA